MINKAIDMTDGPETRLLEAAERVFAEKGYKAASVREICKQAGLNIAGVNYYFGDKERLYIEAVKYAHRGCTEGVAHFRNGARTRRRSRSCATSSA